MLYRGEELKAPRYQPGTNLTTNRESSEILSVANRIQESFNRSAKTYDQHAAIQRETAETLARLIPAPKAPRRILEIGCGTGLASKVVLQNFKEAHLTVSDPSSNMLDQAKQNLKNDLERLTFEKLNPEQDTINQTYDLIIANMVIHWFENMETTLPAITKALAADGGFYFSTIGNNCFPEWQSALAKNNLPLGLRLPTRPNGIIKEEQKPITYESPHGFLKSLKKTGAVAPRAGYTPLPQASLKKAMRDLAHANSPQTTGAGCGEGVTLTWHILYGYLTK